MRNDLCEKCFGCGVKLPGEVGVYYCPTCVAEQQAEYQDEAQAFDDYHRWADSVRGVRPV